MQLQILKLIALENSCTYIINPLHCVNYIQQNVQNLLMTAFTSITNVQVIITCKSQAITHRLITI